MLGQWDIIWEIELEPYCIPHLKINSRKFKKTYENILELRYRKYLHQNDTKIGSHNKKYQNI